MRAESIGAFMGALVKVQTLLFLAIAIGLYAVSHSIELRGDAAPFNPNGVSTERAAYHITALVLMLGALGFFIAAGVTLFRKTRN